jgi:hypothetical protein
MVCVLELAVIVNLADATTLLEGIEAGILVTIGFIGPMPAGELVWKKIHFKLFLICIGDQLVTRTSADAVPTRFQVRRRKDSPSPRAFYVDHQHETGTHHAHRGLHASPCDPRWSAKLGQIGGRNDAPAKPLEEPTHFLEQSFNVEGFCEECQLVLFKERPCRLV